MKLSFPLPSKPSSTKPKPAIFLEEKPEDDKPKPEFVTEFDSSPIVSQKPKFVIPKQENSWLPMKKMKKIDFPHSDLQFEVEEYASNTDSDMSYGLNLRKRDDGFENRTDEDVGQEKLDSVEKVLVQKFKQDMNDLPDDRGMDEFNEVPLEEFGAALLAGYGWSEGKGIGRNAKEDVKVVQYVGRAGFTQEHHELEKKISKLKEMGEEVSVGEDEVAELGSVEEERCLQKLKIHSE